MLLLLLFFVFLLHRHNGTHGVCDVLAAAMRQNPLMHIIGYDIPPRPAFHGGAACSCVTCCSLHIFTFLLFNQSQFRTKRSCNLVEHVDIHGILPGFNATYIRSGNACNLGELLLLPALGCAHRSDALAHGLTFVINDLVFFHIVYIFVITPNPHNRAACL